MEAELKININIIEFYNSFKNNYEDLYTSGDRIAGYREAVADFDEFLKENSDFVGEFAKYRGDFISSDRERRAFMFALEECGVDF